MALPETYTPDPSINQDIRIRRARRHLIVWRFKQDGLPYMITDDFEFNVKSSERKTAADVLNITSANGLVIEDNEIRVSIDEVQSDIARQVCFYELKNLTTVQNWFNGIFPIVTGESPGSEVHDLSDITINLGEQIIEVEMIVAPVDGELDGGSASSVYLESQLIDGGGA